MGGILGVLIFFAIGLVAGPIAANATGHGLSGLTTAIMVVSGIGLLVISASIFIVTRLYKKTKASEALVRTGRGGAKVILDGGALVVPVIHDIVRVSLETLRLKVSRAGPQALITKDKLRADIDAEFFIRVMPLADSVLAAARSLGDKMSDPTAVRALVEDKLVSALRTVAAQKTLEELNSDRASFMEQVTSIVRADLEHNGFTLEVPTLSSLDQTDPKLLNPNNVFDAHGLRTIAEITQAQRTKQNELERAGDQARKQQDVETKKRLLGLEQEQAQAEAEQKSRIAQVQAEQNSLVAQKTAEQEQAAKQKQIEAERAIELAGLEKQRQTEVATREQQQAVEVAERTKQQAVVAADQQLEVARRQQEQAIAAAETDRTAKQAELAKAEAARETATQAIETVKVRATAERNRDQQVIAAEAEAQKQYVTKAKAADADAYALQKQADAKRAAAEASAAATLTQATADADAQKKRAEGLQAEQMVPVEVKRAEVDVETKRVGVQNAEADVEIRLLEQREKFGKAGIDLQVKLAEIAAEKDARIAAAHAMGEALAAADMTIWGSQETLDKVMARFGTGQSLAQAVNGFTSAASPETQALGANFGLVLKALAKKFGLTEAEIAAAAAAEKPDGSKVAAHKA